MNSLYIAEPGTIDVLKAQSRGTLGWCGGLGRRREELQPVRTSVGER